jgi:hypothetical protein
VSHHFHIFTLEHVDSYLNRYEWTEMVLLHKSLFASKWMQAMRTALGGTFTGNNAFALLYVMYNPVCRRDIHQKRRLANHMIAEALLPVELEYSGRQKNFLFYIKSSWAVFKFAIKNRALADCNPTLVLSASKCAHAAIFKDLNRILLLVENSERDAQTNWNIARNSILAKVRTVQALKKIPVSFQDSQVSFNHDARHSSQKLQPSVTWLQQIQNCWKRTNRVVPTQIDNQQRQDDAPKLFVDQFDLKRSFLEENIDEEARLSLLTLMIFPDAEDFGLSRDCKVYKKQFDENLESFRSAFRALFRLSKELKSVDPSENLTRKERIFHRISDMIFGEEMKLLRNFHWLADEDAVDLFRRHQFPELETEFERIPSVDEVLKQLVAKDMNTSVEDPTIGSQSQAPKGSHQNIFHSTLLKFAPATHEPSERRTAERTESAPLAAAKGPCPNAARSRSVMYSSQRILAAARESVGIGHSDFAGLLQQDMTSENAVTCAELSRARDDNASLTAQVKALEANLQIETANARDALAKEAKAQEELLRLAERVLEAEQRAVDAEATASSFQAQSSTAKQRAFLMEAELRALRDELSVASVAVQPAAASDADADATSSAAVVATLSSEVKHLQDALAAASQVSAQLEHSKSSEVAVLSAELTRARAEISFAVQRAVNAEAGLRALRDELSVASVAVQPAAASDADADATSSAAVVATLSSSIPSSELPGDSECIRGYTVIRGTGHSFVDIDAVGFQNDAGGVKYSDVKSAAQASSTVSERSAAATKAAAEFKAAQIALLGLDHIEHQWKQLAAAREEISQARGWRPAAAAASARRSRPSTAGASASKDSMKANPASVGYSSGSNADMNVQSVGSEVAPPKSRSPTRPSSSPSYMTAAPLRSHLPSSRAKTGDDEVSPSFKEVLYRVVNRYVGGSCMSPAASPTRVSLTHAAALTLLF